MPYMPRSSLRRTACDKCRTQKLKCLRDDGQLKCIRCTKLNILCEVGRAGRPGRPRKPNSVAATSSSPNDAAGTWEAPDDIAQQPAIEQPQGLFLGDENLDLGIDASPGDFASGAGDYDIPMQEPLQDDFNIDPALTNQEVPNQSQAITSIPFIVNQHECLRELSRLNVELHAQTVMLKEDPESLTFVTFVCALPQPEGDGMTICERCLTFSQRLHRIMANLVKILKTQSRVREESRSLLFYYEDTLTPEVLSNSSGSSNQDLPTIIEPCTLTATTTTTTTTTIAEGNEGGPPVLDSPVILLLISCYVQIIEVLETIFDYVHRRLDAVDNAPMPEIDPTKGVQLGVFYSADARLEGMVYCQIVTVLLDRIERGLGLMPDQRHCTGLGAQTGLLSRPHHFELLQQELGEKAPNRSARPWELRDSVERARLVMGMDTTWEEP